MRGIQYVTNDQGKKTAVLIDLEKYGDIWKISGIPQPPNAANMSHGDRLHL